MSKMTKFLGRMAVISGGAVVAAPAFAAGPDYSSLTSSIDFSSATAAILAIFGLLGSVYVVMKGGNLIMGVLKGR